MYTTTPFSHSWVSFAFQYDSTLLLKYILYNVMFLNVYTLYTVSCNRSKSAHTSNNVVFLILL